MLGVRTTIHRVGPGKGSVYDPDSVTMNWPRNDAA